MKLHDVLVLDGGQGTELERRGLDIKHELWSTVPFLSCLKNENSTSEETEKLLQIVKEMYVDFIDNGSTGLTTLTYQSSLKTLLKFSDGKVTNLQEYADFINKIVEFTHNILQEKQDENKQKLNLVGSIGPYATYLSDGSEYSGDYKDPENKIDYLEYFKPQVDIFVNGNNSEKIDIIALETIPNFEEFKAILSKDFLSLFKEKPLYVSLSANDSGELRDGTSVETIVEKILELENHILKCNPNFIGFGLNCISFKKSWEILHKYNTLLTEKNSKLRFNAIYPNSGELYDGETHTWYREPPSATLGQVEPTWDYLVEKFVNCEKCTIIGGCCRTTPNDIKQISQAIYRVKQKYHL